MKKSSKAGVLFLIVVCLLLIRMTSHERELTQVERLIVDASLPIQRILTEGTQNVVLFFQGISRYPLVETENQELRAEIARLEMEARRDRSFYYENIRLRRLLDLHASLDYDLVAAEVVARSVKSWEDIMVIDKGMNHGVSVNDGVMTYNGLVGRVFSVSGNTARVRILNDRLAAVAAMTERTRFPGVVEGIGDGSGLLHLTYLPYDATVEVNQNVITSGLGGTIPRGIRIGYISAIQYSEDGLVKRAIVTPYEDLNRIEKVLVIRGGGGLL